MFSKKDMWILYYVTGLIVFFVLAAYFLRPLTVQVDSYNYDTIIRYLSREVDELTYGDNEYNIEKFNYLSKSIDNTKNSVLQSYIELKRDYKNNLYNITEYYTIKRRYEYNLKRLDSTLKLLNEKVPK